VLRQEAVHLRFRLPGRLGVSAHGMAIEGARRGETIKAAALPVTQEPDGAMLLNHLAAMHRDQVEPYLRRMETEDIATVAAEAYEVIDGDEAL
jgi:hypothetical protein